MVGYYIALVIGWVITVVGITATAYTTYYLSHAPHQVYKSRARRGCVASAELEDFSSDDNNVYTGNYSYQWAGRSYNYTKRFFSEQPTPTVDLCWDPATPNMPKEQADLVFDKHAAIKYSAIMAVLAGIFSLISYQLMVLVLGIVICGLMMLHNKGMKAVLIGLVCFNLAFFTLGEWTYTYGDSYAHTRYEEICMGVRHIDELEPQEILDLYDRWYWTREEFESNISQGRMPFMCQFADTFYMDKELPDWPDDYYKYTQWEFRDKLQEELRHANS